MIATGAKPGATLWVQAAVHGGEIGGTLGIVRCLERINLQSMSGAIVGVLAANPLAFRTQTRNTPIDGENMNRLFPGAANGSITRQMARNLMDAAAASADLVLDLHSGGHEAIVPFYSLYWDDGSEASRKAAGYARSAATNVIWAARDEWLAGAMFTQLTRQGTPALIVECGGGAGLPDRDIEAFALAIEGVARAAEILPGGPVRQEHYRTIGSCDLVYTQRGGFFIPACAAGDTLGEGEPVGLVVDVFGRCQETITTPKRAFVAAIGRPYLPVQSGAMIAELNDDHGWN
jgi:predicted deacylase